MQPSKLPKPPGPSENVLPKGDLKPLEEKLERALTSAVPEKADTVRKIVRKVLHAECYSGPLPHPQHLDHFEQIVPGAADRIIAMAEREQDHRHTWEKTELESLIVTERIGLFGGIAVAFLLIIGAVVCGIVGATHVGVALVAASAVSMVPAIIKGRDRLRETAKKSPVVPDKKQPPNLHRR